MRFALVHKFLSGKHRWRNTWVILLFLCFVWTYLLDSSIAFRSAGMLRDVSGGILLVGVLTVMLLMFSEYDRNYRNRIGPQIIIPEPKNYPEFYIKLESIRERYRQLNLKQVYNLYKTDGENVGGFPVGISAAFAIYPLQKELELYLRVYVLVGPIRMVFDDLDRAINCFLNALSANTRLDFSKQGVSFRYNMNNDWVDLVHVRFHWSKRLLGRSTVEFRQNSFIPAKDLTIRFAPARIVGEFVVCS